MSLRHDLDQFRAAWAASTPPERVSLYQDKIGELQRSFAASHAVGAGDAAPPFTLPGADGQPVRLQDRLRAGPVVLAFYRGGWCPYCNLQLRAYQTALPRMAAVGASLVAISPQQPDASLSTAEANALTFDVLSDAGNAVARAYGLVFALPAELRDGMRAAGKALPDINGDDTWELPVPATFVLGTNGAVALAFVEADHRLRLEPDDIIRALERLPP